MPNALTVRQAAWAASNDAGHRSMRAGGRAQWNRSDYNAAVREFIRLRPEERSTILRARPHDDCTECEGLLPRLKAGVSARETR